MTGRRRRPGARGESGAGTALLNWLSCKCRWRPARLLRWDDQCGTLPCIAEVVYARLCMASTLPGLDLLLPRLGWSVHVLARTAAERIEKHRLAGRDLAGDQRTAANLGARGAFEDGRPRGCKPPKGRTWGRRGCTAVVQASSAGSPRLSLAALLATKPGHHAWAPVK